jgi:hypothetical protein
MKYLYSFNESKFDNDIDIEDLENMLLDIQDEGYKALISGPHNSGFYHLRIISRIFKLYDPLKCFREVEPYLTHFLSYMKENGFYFSIDTIKGTRNQIDVWFYKSPKPEE